MQNRFVLLLICIFTFLNLTILAINMSVQSYADVGGMNYRELKRDKDFKRAVESIVEDCQVVDQSRLSC